MEEILNALLDVVREQQRGGTPPEAAMSRSDVVNMALKMMQQQGTEIEQDTVTETWRTILRLAPNLFGSDTSDVPAAALSPSEQIIRHMEPDKKITEGNENIQLDKMIFQNFQSMLGGAGGEIKTGETPKEEAPKPVVRPKSAAELAADAIREAEENKRNGITQKPPKPGTRRPVTNKKQYKGIPKAANTVKGGEGQGVSASQLAYEAQRKAQERAAEEARIREELQNKMAEEAMKRGEPDPRIEAAKEKERLLAAQREMELKRSQAGQAPMPEPEPSGRQETPEEKRARVEAEQEARRAREWAEAEAEAKAAKERARAEREAKAIEEARKAEEEKQKEAREKEEKDRLSRMSPEEAKAAKERARRREAAREEAKAAKDAQNEKNRQEAAKLIKERAQIKTEKAARTTKKAVESIQQGMAQVLGDDPEHQPDINEEELNQLVMTKYQEMIRGGTKAADIDMVKLTSMVMDALLAQSGEEEPEQDLDNLIDEAWGDKEPGQEKSRDGSQPVAAPQETLDPRSASAQKILQPKAEKIPAKPEKNAASTAFSGDDLTISFKNVKSMMGDFEEFLHSGGKGGRIHTGIEPVDQLLPSGLEPGFYTVWAEESIGADAFALQVGDYIASRGRDVLYLLTDSSRYSMMIKSISRLSYELRGKKKEAARSQASIMGCKSKEDMANLKNEFAHYEGHIGEHLYLMEQKTIDGGNITGIIKKIAEVFRQEKQATPVILLDDIYWILKEEERLSGDLADLAKELGLPILASVGSGDYENGELFSTDIRICYTGVGGNKEKLFQKEIEAENGETLAADLKVIRADTGRQMSARLCVTPKFYYFDKVTKEAGGC